MRGVGRRGVPGGRSLWALMNLREGCSCGASPSQRRVRAALLHCESARTGLMRMTKNVRILVVSNGTSRVSQRHPNGMVSQSTQSLYFSGAKANSSDGRS
jgi:hypothetical protein